MYIGLTHFNWVCSTSYTNCHFTWELYVNQVPADSAESTVKFEKFVNRPISDTQSDFRTAQKINYHLPLALCSTNYYRIVFE